MRTVKVLLVIAGMMLGAMLVGAATASARPANGCQWYVGHPPVGNCDVFDPAGYDLSLQFGSYGQVGGSYVQRPTKTIWLDRAGAQNPRPGAWTQVGVAQGSTPTFHSGNQWWRVCTAYTPKHYICTGFHNQHLGR